MNGNLFVPPIGLAVAFRLASFCWLCGCDVPSGFQLVRIQDPPGSLCEQCGREVDEEAAELLRCVVKNEAKRRQRMPV